MEMHPQELRLKMRDDSTFCDYVNKFCCLPVFGQRLTFMHQTSKFVYDPPPVRHVARGFKISNDFVRNWIINERLKLFIRSKLSSEFNLCKALQKIDFVRRKYDSHRRKSRSTLQSNPNSSSGYNLLDDLKSDHLTKVRHMRRFIQFVALTSQVGDQLINFWIEVDFMKQCNEKTQNEMLKELKKKYYLSTSLSCLPYHMLEGVYSGYVAGKQTENFQLGIEFTLLMQNHALSQLHFYWLPRYLISCKNVGQPEKLLIRKLEFLASFNKEEELKEALILKSRFIRHIPRVHEAKGSEIQQVEQKPVEKKDSFQKKFVDDHEKSETEIFAQSAIISEGPPPMSHIAINQVQTREFLQQHWRRKSKFFFNEDDASSSSSLDVVRNMSASGGAHPHQHRNEESDRYAKPTQSSRKSKKIKEFKRKSGVESDLLLEKKSKKTKSHPKQARKCKSETMGMQPVGPKIPKSNSCFDRFPDSLQSMNPPSRDNHREASYPRSQHRSLGESQTKILRSWTSLKRRPNPLRHASDMGVESSFTADFAISSEQFCKSYSSSESSELQSRHSRSTENLPPTEMERPSILRKRRQAFVEEVTSKSTQLFTQDAQEYLENVEADIGLSDILTSDIVAASPFRRFLSKLPKVQSFSSLITNGEYIPNIDLTAAYDIWQEIESLRTTYFELSIDNLKNKVKTFISTYEEHHRALFKRLRRLKIRNDRPFPDELLSMQHAIEKLLEPEWVKFAIEEQEHFRLSVVSSEKKVYPRRHSFPMTVPETLSKQILPTPLLARLPGDSYDDFEQVVQSGKLGILGKSTVGHMKYRISRAYRLLTNMAGRRAASDSDFMEIVAEESSDDEGGLPMLKPRTFVRLPDVSAKEIAKLSVREYPKPEVYKSKTTVAKPREKLKLEIPYYMRPVKRNGVIVHRPMQRPRHFGEVLKDWTHFEFFKKYMKMHQSDAPLLFWKAVQVLKRTETAEMREEKAKEILNRYFGRSAGGGAILQCEADIISEIVTADVVTTSMLVYAAQEVAKSLEKNWAERYYNTFSIQTIEEPEEVTAPKVPSVHMIKASRVWRVFSDFIRSVACFLQCMKDTKQFYEFRQWLKKLPETEEDAPRPPGVEASSTALLFKKYELVVYKHLKEELDVKYQKKKILGKEVVLNFLVHDFMFWFETEKFTHFCDDVKQLKKLGVYERNDIKNVKQKRTTIVRCFINSDIPPKLRINISANMAHEVMFLYKRFDINRSMFHQARMAVFPTIMFYWKKYRLETLSYVSKKTAKERHKAEVEQRRNKKQKGEELRKQQMLARTLARLKLSSADLLEEEDQMDSFLPEPEKKQDEPDEKRCQKVKGLVHTDPPKLHFSLESGMKFVVPPKKRVIEKVNDGEEEVEPTKKEFVEVWTRGAKLAKVIRQGSDPLLVSTSKKRYRYVVKCDMIQSEKGKKEGADAKKKEGTDAKK